MELSTRKKFSAIMANIQPLEKNAWAAIADSVPLPGIFILVPLAMLLVMFLVPLLVRKDYRGAIRGVFMLPVTTILCYIFASLLNLVIAASVNLALYFYLGMKPGADFFMYLVHPLYLVAPAAMKNLPGSISQCIYLAFIVSVLTTPGKRRWVPAEEGDDEYGEPYEDDATYAHDAADDEPDMDDDPDYKACVLETDRLSRIIETRTGQPSLAHSIRAGISDYIEEPGKVAKSCESGMAPYKIVLIEAAKSLKSTMEETPDRQGAKDTFAYIINELERMEYCNPKECATLREWLERR